MLKWLMVRPIRDGSKVIFYSSGRRVNQALGMVPILYAPWIAIDLAKFMDCAANSDCCYSFLSISVLISLASHSRSLAGPLLLY